MTRNEVTNVLLIGTGGQGTILVSDILSLAVMKDGYDVKKSEIHGMAQRGGSVSSHVRFGSKVYSPLIPEGKTDYMLAFEEMEALRYLPYLKKDAVIILNRQQVKPPSVLLGQAQYPKEVIEKLEQACKVQPVDGLKLAKELENIRVANIITLGVLANYLDVPDAKWLEAIKEVLPSRLHEINEKAFMVGREQKQI